MNSTDIVNFEPYRLDLGEERLWRGDDEVRLTAKAFAVLRYLVTYAGRLVPRDTLFDDVWGTPYVTEAALATCIREIRRVLKDNAHQPQFVETVRGRGYRFVAPVTSEVSASALAATPTRPPLGVAETAPALLDGLLVGRDSELDELEHLWGRVAEGATAVACVWGEAGIGKTQLANAFRLRLAERNLDTVQAKCVEAAGELAYLPLLRWLRSPSNWRYTLELDDVWLAELARLMPEILIERPALTLRPLHHDLQLRVLFEALTQAVAMIPQPRYLQLDDLQWCDQGTLDWLIYFLDSPVASHTLLMVTARPEDIDSTHSTSPTLSALRERGMLVELTLNALDMGQTEALVRALDVELVETAQVQQLFQDTGGVPLFIVETVRAGLADVSSSSGGAGSGATSGESNQRVQRLPARMQAVIESRLAKLGEESGRLVDTIAVHGRPIDMDLLSLVHTADEDEILVGLDELWQKGVLVDHKSGQYDFSHDRIRDVALTVLSPVKRRQLHRRLAGALAQLYANRPDAVVGQLAMHFDQAGMFNEAIGHYMRAGQVNHRMCAFTGAIQHFKKGIALLTSQPSSDARVRLEAEFWLNLSFSYLESKGSHGGLFHRAALTSYELFKSLNLEERAGEALAGVFLAELRRGQIDNAHREALAVRKIADQYQTERLLLMAHEALACTSFFRGVFDTSLENLEALSALAQAAPEASASISWFDPQVQFSCFSSHTQWLLGRPDHALQLCRQGQVDAQQKGSAFQRILSGVYQAMLYQLRGEPEALIEVAEQARKLGEKDDLAYYVHWAYMLEAWAEADKTPDVTTIAALNDAIATFEATGARLRLCYFWSLLVPMFIRAQRYDDASQTLEHAREMAQQNGEHWWDAELERLRGWLVLECEGNVTAAGTAYERALEVARAQNSPALELRALCSLVELSSCGQDTDGWRLQLEAVLARFTEGWDSADLKHAQTLVDRREH